MIVMAINDRKPVMEQCFTEKYGTYQCVRRRGRPLDTALRAEPCRM